MKSSILQIEESKIVVANKVALAIGSLIDFDIIFPEGSIIRSLGLQGIVKDCSKIETNESTNYIIEVAVSEMEETKRLILQSYIKYLERERLIDEMRNKLDLKGLTEGIVECGEECFKYSAVKEYIWAKINKTEFH